MSTAGKVLTVLILLVMVVWNVFLAATTQLNMNYGDKNKKQEARLESLQAEADKAARDVIRLTEEARLEQDAKGRDLRELLGRIVIAERRQSSTIESLSRLQAQLADTLENVERAKQNLATREAEQAKAEEDIVKKKDEVAKAQVVNNDLRGQVARLQDEFKRLLAENAAKVQAAKEQQPATKPASSRRASPST